MQPRELIYSPNQMAHDFFQEGLHSKQEGLLDEAISAFNLAISLDDEQPEYYRERGVIYLTKNEFDLCIQDLNEELEITISKGDSYIDVACITADILMLDNKCQKTQWIVYGAKKHFSHYLKTHFIKIKNEIGNDEYKKNIFFNRMYELFNYYTNEKTNLDFRFLILNMLIKLSPSAKLYYHRGFLHARNNKDKALEDYNTAMMFDKKSGNEFKRRIAYERGLLYLEKQNIASAYLDFVEASNENIMAYLKLGEIQAGFGNEIEEIMYYMFAIQADPVDEKINSKLERVLSIALKNKYDDTIVEIEKCAVNYTANMKYKMAIKCYDTIILMNKGTSKHYTFLGDSWLRCEKYDTAIRIYFHALQFDNALTFHINYQLAYAYFMKASTSPSPNTYLSYALFHFTKTDIRDPVHMKNYRNFLEHIEPEKIVDLIESLDYDDKIKLYRQCLKSNTVIGKFMRDKYAYSTLDTIQDRLPKNNTKFNLFFNMGFPKGHSSEEYNEKQIRNNKK